MLTKLFWILLWRAIGCFDFYYCLSEPPGVLIDCLVSVVFCFGPILVKVLPGENRVRFDLSFKSEGKNLVILPRSIDSRSDMGCLNVWDAE